MKHISSTTQMATRRNAATQWRCAAAAAMAGPSCTLLPACGKPAAAQGPTRVPLIALVAPVPTP